MSDLHFNRGIVRNDSQVAPGEEEATKHIVPNDKSLNFITETLHCSKASSSRQIHLR
jgi:hypothetical protein